MTYGMTTGWQEHYMQGETCPITTLSAKNATRTVFPVLLRLM